MAAHSSAGMDRLEYLHARMKSSFSSFQSALVTSHSNVVPELVESWSETPAFGIAGTLMSFVNLTYVWSIGLPFSSNVGTFTLGIRRLTSTSMDMNDLRFRPSSVIHAPLAISMNFS